MLIKVCGMRETANMQEVAALGVDWMGFIFYERSPRQFVGTIEVPATVRRVGVFVNATHEAMLAAATLHRLDYLQLHGHESPDDCYALRKRGLAVIKAISIASADDLAQADAYQGLADYLLFDTKCTGYGGSGQSFDWSILEAYHGTTPFLLSGGIGPESVRSLRHFHHPQLAGVDVNSRFESAPGHKDVEKLRGFIEEMNTDNKQ